MNSVPSLSANALSPELAVPLASRERGTRAAREFEAHLIGSLLESLEKTFAGLPGETSLPGAEDYNYIGTQALAEALAERGGFGLATLIAQHLPDARR
jgi:Rod binding domain-containing protein